MAHNYNPPAIDEMVVLANLCIELLHETLDYYAEALNGYDRLMCEMNETFWMFYGRDMEANLRLVLRAYDWQCFSWYKLHAVLPQYEFRSHCFFEL